MSSNVKRWDDLPLMLSTADVAAIFGVTERTVRNWIDHGLLTAITIGGTVRVERDYLHSLALHGGPEKGKQHD